MHEYLYHILSRPRRRREVHKYLLREASQHTIVEKLFPGSVKQEGNQFYFSGTPAQVAELNLRYRVNTSEV
jgi:hypothetical protein